MKRLDVESAIRFAPLMKDPELAWAGFRAATSYADRRRWLEMAPAGMVQARAKEVSRILYGTLDSDLRAMMHRYWGDERGPEIVKRVDALVANVPGLLEKACGDRLGPLFAPEAVKAAYQLLRQLDGFDEAFGPSDRGLVVADSSDYTWMKWFTGNVMVGLRLEDPQLDNMVPTVAIVQAKRWLFGGIDPIDTDLPATAGLLADFCCEAAPLSAPEFLRHGCARSFFESALACECNL